jgi:alkylation response protein AidB-like acyl-CoA dehydrogenase
MLDLALVAEATGAALAPVPVVDHLVAARAFPEPDVIDGEAIASVALHPAHDGRWPIVPAGAVAQVVVGLDGDDLVSVRSDPPGAALRNHADAAMAHRSTSGDRVVLGGRAEFAGVLTEWKLLQAAALAGLAARALEIGTDYAKERTHFDRPIGAFQAVQHGLAECLGPVEGARLLARKAAWAVDRGTHGELAWDENEVYDPAALASMAIVFAAETAALTTKRALQYHGAYGFAREYDIQLYHRRARGWPLLLGDPTRERAVLADLLWPREGD